MIRNFGLTPSNVGLLYGLRDGANSLASPIWGFLCDRVGQVVVRVAVRVTVRVTVGIKVRIGDMGRIEVGRFLRSESGAGEGVETVVVPVHVGVQDLGLG